MVSLEEYIKHYENLQNNWNKIFPDNNRNAGGVQFFYYLYKKMNLTKKEFDIYNKFYCGVSGSLIGPERVFEGEAKDLVRIKTKSGNFKCGHYYRCCWPCLADIMNHEKLDVVVEKINLKLKDGEFMYHLLTIPDPCKKSIVYENKEILPNPKNNSEPWFEVTSFKCKKKKTKNAVRTKSGRIVFAILFEPKKCTLQEYKEHPDFNSEFYKKIVERNTTEKLSEWGMGQIFIELAKK